MPMVFYIVVLFICLCKTQFLLGSMTEGIYRRAGSGTAVSELLAQFRKDAWAVQLTEKYSEHDVATALKRFFRDLPEPLLMSSKRQYLYQVSRMYIFLLLLLLFITKILF